jgi:hypothetical protein
MHINSGLFISDSEKRCKKQPLTFTELARVSTTKHEIPMKLYESESYTLNPKLEPLRKFGTSNPAT